MSFSAVDKILALDVRPSARKFVLVAIAKFANNKTGEAFPSTNRICEITSQNYKTVVSALDSLEKDGFIVDTKKRVGRNKQVKVFSSDAFRSGGAKAESK